MSFIFIYGSKLSEIVLDALFSDMTSKDFDLDQKNVAHLARQLSQNTLIFCSFNQKHQKL